MLRPSPDCTILGHTGGMDSPGVSLWGEKGILLVVVAPLSGVDKVRLLDLAP